MLAPLSGQPLPLRRLSHVPGAPWAPSVSPPTGVPPAAVASLLPPVPRVASDGAGAAALPWQSPPRRPTAPSWSPAAPATAAPTHRGDCEPDADEAEGPVMGEEVLGKEDGARQLAQALGAERLYDAFCARESGGCVPVERIPELLSAAGVETEASEMAVALPTVCPEADTTGRVTYQQCQELFFHLKLHRRASGEGEERKGGRFMCWAEGMSDDRSTNLLLVVVVTLCCISAFLAGGVAILLLMLDDTNNVKAHLQENIGIVQDTLEVYASQIAVQESNDQQAMFAATLGSVLHALAFTDTVAANTKQLLRVATALGNTVGSWWSYLPLVPFTYYAILAATLASSTASTYGVNAAGAVFTQVNAKLASNWEIILARWAANSTSQVEYLTTLRKQSQCRTACPTNGTAAQPLMAALAGATAAGLATSYVNTLVVAGYTSVNGLAAQVNFDQSSLTSQRYTQTIGYTAGWTAASDSWEFILGARFGAGSLGLLSSLPGCLYVCQQAQVAPGMPMYRALMGQTGTMMYITYRGVQAVAAFAPLLGTTSGIVIHMNYSAIVAKSMQTLTTLVDRLNRDYPSGTEEFEATSFVGQGNDTVFTRLSAYRFADGCPSGQCVVATEYVQLAARNCSASAGVMRSTDYRGQPVLVGYTCVSEMGVVLSTKIDLATVAADAVDAAVEAVNDRTARDNDTSAQFLVAVPKGGLTAAEVRGYGDFDVVSRLKYPASCAEPNCTWRRASALRALQGYTDVFDTRDYRNVAVLAAPVLSDVVPTGIGLALEQDHREAFQPTHDVAIRVGGFAIGVAVGCTLLLVLVTKWMLRSMIRAKEEGRRAVGAEKDRLSRLVASMYPPFVVPRLLEGEKQLVCEVPGAAVFFSDIHEFTSASNTMNSKELLSLMGYVYGVMDRIADHCGVYKVKTIGDAYLAVCGLPGSDIDNPSFELLRFASFVCQVFGDRFVHPPEGQVLARMNRAMQWNRLSLSPSGRPPPAPRGRAKELDATESPAPSVNPSSRESRLLRGSRPSLAGAGSPRGREPPAQCVMSYGLAVGRIVAGVLGGRCPMFDIWGGTVNLASRMQSTGEPGRIQVSEQLYKKVVALPGQPFSFEEPRGTYCKGFGTVSAYLVRTTAEGLPKGLQEELGLEPRYGAFYFDNLLAPPPT